VLLLVYLEGFTATTGSGDIGILEFEACSLYRFHIVDLSTPQMGHTPLVHEDLKPTHPNHLIAFATVLLQIHHVLEARAPSGLNGDSDAGIAFRLFGDELLDPLHRPNLKQSGCHLIIEVSIKSAQELYIHDYAK